MNHRILASVVILGLALAYVILVGYSIGAFYRLFSPWQAGAAQSPAAFYLSLHSVHALAVLAAAIPPAAVIAWRYQQKFFIPALLTGVPIVLIPLGGFIDAPGTQTSFTGIILNLKDLAILMLAPSLMAWLMTRWQRPRTSDAASGAR